MPSAVEDVVDRLGGAEATARLLGVGTEAIRKWRQAQVIPSRHWPALLVATGLPLGELPGAGVPATVRSVPNVSVRKPMPEADAPPQGATAALVLGDGSVVWGRGFGAHTVDSPPREATGEVCFNTGMTGYQETLTDPSYAGQIIAFTFPHIGNVGVNPCDNESAGIAARGLILRQDISEPSNWRAVQGLDAWVRGHGVTGISGVDTRALTIRIRDSGAPSGVLAFPATGMFDLPALRSRVNAWPGLAGMDLAREVSCTQSYEWSEAEWTWPDEFSRPPTPRRHVVAVDYGAKRNILRSLASAGCRVTVVPAMSSAEDILRHRPDGVFLSNGPGDPAATGIYAVPAIRGVLDAGVPVFGICLGHQLLAIALGSRTYKLDRGHRGANQPVKDLSTGRVEITSQNHGFAVDGASLPASVKATHVSLFDGTNEGLACTDMKAFSVQYHPEASPGPRDAHHLFERFVAMMEG